MQLRELHVPFQHIEHMQIFLDGAQGGTEWGIPQAVAGLPSGGIASIAAGARASAAVTGDGKLWMWGRLMAADNARWAWRDTGILAIAAHNKLAPWQEARRHVLYVRTATDAA